jgi:outer membrane lipoprotein-sorting protein
MTGTHRVVHYVFSNRMLFSVLLSTALLAGAPSQSLDQILARMDQNANTFKSMKAKLRHLSHVAVINEDNVSTGTMSMRRTKREVHALVEFTAPDPKAVAFSGTKVEIYYPKLQTVEEYDVRKNLVEKYLVLGFGSSGKELKADYALRELGAETLNAQQTTRLELIPKSKEVLQQFPKIEWWIADATGYPVQQKFYQTGGDYMSFTYSDVAINPSLPDSAFKLNVPKGVKRVFPGK